MPGTGRAPAGARKVLDYKDISFSFRDRTLRRRRRLLRLLLLALLGAAVFLGFRSLQARALVAQIEDLLLAGRTDEAGQRLQAASPIFQRGNFRELRALADLCRGRLPEAASRFAELRRGGFATSLRSGRMLANFFDRGEFGKLAVYIDYLLPRGNDEALWFHALCRAAFLDADAAEKALAGLSAAYRRDNGKAVELLARFTRSLRSGRIDYVFDRNDLPISTCGAAPAARSSRAWIFPLSRRSSKKAPAASA
jgi:3',5'-cyclic AMP phosphodiesterase CpdA